RHVTFQAVLRLHVFSGRGQLVQLARMATAANPNIVRRGLAASLDPVRVMAGGTAQLTVTFLEARRFQKTVSGMRNLKLVIEAGRGRPVKMKDIIFERLSRPIEVAPVKPPDSVRQPQVRGFQVTLET